MNSHLFGRFLAFFRTCQPRYLCTFVCKKTILPAFALLCLLGCKSIDLSSDHDQLKYLETAYYWGQETFLTLNTSITGPPEPWSLQADDTSLDRETRRLAGALLFGAFVRPNFRMDQMRSVLSDARWLDDCSLTRFLGGTGKPLWLTEGTHYILYLFPEHKEDSTWAIYFTLSLEIDAEDQNAVQIGLDFLRGKMRKSDAILTEFVLVYPMPGCENPSSIEERHSKRGVGVKFQPARWFGQ